MDQRTPAQDVLTAATIGLAAHRLTRLVVIDTIWAAARATLKAKLRKNSRPIGTILDEESKQAVKRYRIRSWESEATVSPTADGDDELYIEEGKVVVFPIGSSRWSDPFDPVVARRFAAAKTVDAISCQQCAGVWVTLATIAAWHYGGDRTRTAVRIAALCGIQSILVRYTT